MKIGLDATYSVGDNLSGVGVYCRELLHGLAAIPEHRWIWYYRPHRLRRGFQQPVPQNCRRTLLLDQFSPRVDLFHGLNQRLPRKLSSPAVVTFHDLFVLTGDYSTSDFRARFAQQARHAAQAADLVLAVSEFTARQVHEHLNVSMSRIAVTYHGVRFPQFPPAPREPIVLSVGAIQKRKNLVRLIRAFEAMPPGWRLVLAGSQGYEAEEVVRAAETSPRSADIQLTGWIDDAALTSLYARASIFAFPSLDEGFGIPVLEAMAAGIPVLTSNRSALPEIAGDAALLADPLSEDEIAAALRRLANDDDLRNSLIEGGRRRAQQFTWANTVAKTLEAYRPLLPRAG